MLYEVRKRVVVPGEIKYVPLNKWANVSFQNFEKLNDGEEKNTRMLNTIVTDYQKDLFHFQTSSVIKNVI